MKIDRLKIATALNSAGLDLDKAAKAAEQIGEAYDEAESNMADLKDVKAISDQFEARLNAAINRQIIWTISVGALIIAAMAAFRFWH